MWLKYFASKLCFWCTLSSAAIKKSLLEGLGLSYWCYMGEVHIWTRDRVLGVKEYWGPTNSFVGSTGEAPKTYW